MDCTSWRFSKFLYNISFKLVWLLYLLSQICYVFLKNTDSRLEIQLRYNEKQCPTLWQTGYLKFPKGPHYSNSMNACPGPSAWFCELCMRVHLSVCIYWYKINAFTVHARLYRGISYFMKPYPFEFLPLGDVVQPPQSRRRNSCLKLRGSPRGRKA